MKAIDDVCRWLGSAVVAPLLPVLDQNAVVNITLVSCGWFSVLPVHAAWILDRGNLDGRRYPFIDRGVAYIPNAQVLRAVAALPQTRLAQDVLVVAEPRRQSRSPRLGGGGDRRRAHVAVERRAWRKDEVLPAIPGCTLAHFASHATSLPTQPLKSSIGSLAGTTSRYTS